MEARTLGITLAVIAVALAGCSKDASESESPELAQMLPASSVFSDDIALMTEPTDAHGNLQGLGMSSNPGHITALEHLANGDMRPEHAYAALYVHQDDLEVYLHNIAMEFSSSGAARQYADAKSDGLFCDNADGDRFLLRLGNVVTIVQAFGEPMYAEAAEAAAEIQQRTGASLDCP